MVQCLPSMVDGRQPESRNPLEGCPVRPVGSIEARAPAVPMGRNTVSLVFSVARYTARMARTRDEAARGRVLASARQLVSELGPHVVTVDEIASAAGVGKQTIYRWWPSKSAVIMDALIELTDPVPTEFPDSAYEAIQLQMRRVARMFSSRNGELIRELVADAQGDPAVAKEFRDRFFAHRRARGAATIAKGIADGELRADLDVGDALDILYSPLWLRLLIGHGATSQKAADRFLAMAWPGLRAEDAEAIPKQSRPRNSSWRRPPVPRSAS
jgi:AcrR family transcriptional regulator